MEALRRLWFLGWNFFRSAWKFALAGAVSGVVDFGVYLGLTRGFAWWQEHLYLANAVAFAVANFNSFCLNRYFTFAGGGGRNFWREYFHFAGVSLAYLAVIQLGLWLLINYAHMHDLLAKAVVIACAAILYFSVLKAWVFKTRDSNLTQG